MICSGFSVFCLTFVVIRLILLRSTVISHDVETILPTSWAPICSFTQDNNILGLYVDQLPAERVFLVKCHVSPNDVWSFSTLQAWLKSFTGFLVFLTVECRDEAAISLPWPMKANGLVGLKVSGCRLKDKYADVFNPDISTLPDEMRVLDIRDSVWLSDVAAFELMTQSEVLLGMSADYDCGQDSTLEYIVMSNLTDSLSTVTGSSMGKDRELIDESFKKASNQKDSNQSPAEFALAPGTSAGDPPTTSNSNAASSQKDFLMRLLQSPNISDALAISVSKPLSGAANNATSPTQVGYQDLLKNIQSVDHACVYKRLKVLDESCPSVMSVHHFGIMVQSGSYPELRTMNYSFSGLPEIPQELREFRVFFPKLSYLDLTKNGIRHVALPKSPRTPVSHQLSMDLRHNQITHINLSTVQSWAEIKDIYVDIRFNPIDCGCHMNDLLLAMKSKDFFIDSMAPYKYLKDMKCSSPLSMKDKELASIELVCSSSLIDSREAKDSDNSLSTTNLTILFVFCGLATSILVVVTIVAILYFKKYRFAAVKELVAIGLPLKINTSGDVESGQRTIIIS
ncbi:hypothetical protein EGW08_011648 [Elysia chlorotica]|uniref:LRRCT domain-containing protein n=1 Tax=Elysia chlorotica TaxID=188477 RepID=A0A3S1BC56_ELYCH|nr:hypothetical protein EGW08_011648 [Elysia chlorotica]